MPTFDVIPVYVHSIIWEGFDDRCGVREFSSSVEPVKQGKTTADPPRVASVHELIRAPAKAAKVHIAA